MFGKYKLHHVGIVFPDMASAEQHLSDFGLAESYRGFVDGWSCWCIFTEPEEGAAIELVVPEGGALEVRITRPFVGRVASDSTSKAGPGRRPRLSPSLVKELRTRVSSPRKRSIPPKASGAL